VTDLSKLFKSLLRRSKQPSYNAFTAALFCNREDFGEFDEVADNGRDACIRPRAITVRSVPASAPWRVPLPARAADSGRSIRRFLRVSVPADSRQPSAALRVPSLSGQAECKSNRVSVIDSTTSRIRSDRKRLRSLSGHWPQSHAARRR
jgi:hypothetical protein